MIMMQEQRTKNIESLLCTDSGLRQLPRKQEPVLASTDMLYPVYKTQNSSCNILLNFTVRLEREQESKKITLKQLEKDFLNSG